MTSKHFTFGTTPRKLPPNTGTMYINEFIRSKSSADGAYFAVVQNLPQFNLKDPNVAIIAVGDGSTPRTAATFAFKSAWQCHSVDPELAPRSYKISRLTLHKSRIENAPMKFDIPAIIVAVHSHAKLDLCLASIKAPKVSVVAMPCCVPLYIKGREPDIVYEDEQVWSPHRTVKIWKELRS